MNAYDRMYLEKTQISLGRMFDYAVNDLKMQLEDIWECFLVSSISRQFESGDISIITRPGVELALMVLNIDKDYIKPSYSFYKSEEYWAGWALAYYQWKTGLSFRQINEIVTIEEIITMYTPYHEMDVRQFCDRISELYMERKSQTNLKKRRLEAGLSQSQLAKLTGIPVRTIQQYEQGQKDINKAKTEYVLALSKILCCTVELLIDN